MLNRQQAIADAAPLIEAACPLLREVVDYAGGVLERAIQEPEPGRLGGENEDLATTVLYRHLIELADGVEVLYAAAVVDPSIPLLRAAFEVSMSLDYIHRDPKLYAERSLCWVVGYLHYRMKSYDRHDRRSAQGVEFGAAFSREVGPMGDDHWLSDGEARDASVPAVLGLPSIQPIEADYQTRLKRRGRAPEWFSLMGGPPERRVLAKRMERETEYLTFYSEWSTFSHGNDASRAVRVGRVPGEVAFLALRNASDGFVYGTHLLVRYLLRATRQVSARFRPSESHSDWYHTKVQASWDALRRMQVVTEDDEEHR